MAYGRLGGARLGVYLAIGLLVWYFLLKSGVHATIAGVLLAFSLPSAGQGKESPLERLEHAISPWVAFAIVPLFAFLNAGFALGNAHFAAPVSLGAFVGLLLGKPLGVCGAAFLAVRLGWAALPKGTGWSAIWGAGLLAGIGFTMSLFVAALAFGEGPLDEQAKLGVFSASVLAAVAGLLFLHRVLPKGPAAKKTA